MKPSIRAAAFAAAIALSGASFAQSRFIQAELVNPIKTKKAKVGDPVKARSAAGGTLPNGAQIHAGAILLGQLRSVESNAVTITFDEVDTDGKKAPLKLSIRAAMMPAAPGHSGGRPSEAVAAQAGAVIGLDGVTLQVDDSPAAASKFQASQGELKLDKGLQLMLAPPQ
jgi:hypothetical protein